MQVPNMEEESEKKGLHRLLDCGSDGDISAYNLYIRECIIQLVLNVFAVKFTCHKERICHCKNIITKFSFKEKFSER